MLCLTDALPAPVPVDGVDPRLWTGLELGVGGVVGAGVSFAVSEEDAEAEAEVVKRESLDSPTGTVLLLVSVCVWLSSCSCPCWRSWAWERRRRVAASCGEHLRGSLRSRAMRGLRWGAHHESVRR